MLSLLVSEDSLLASICSVHCQLGQVNLKKPGESLLMIRVTNMFIPQPGRSACFFFFNSWGL